MAERYKYRKPRSFNWVTVLIILLVAGAGYGGWKFGPVWYRNYKVDSVLEELGIAAMSELRTRDDRTRAGEPFVDKARQRIQALGIDDPYLQVYFDASFGNLCADYSVVVRHPFGKRTTLKFHRKGRVPGNALGD